LWSFLTRSNFCEIVVSEFFNSHRDYHYVSHFEIAGAKRISQHLTKDNFRVGDGPRSAA